MLRTILHIFLMTALIAAAFLAIRFLLVEPDEVAIACTSQVLTFSCKLRNAAIYGFAHHIFGPLSLIAVVLGWIGAMRLFAVVAIIAGLGGMVLYDFDIAGFGMLLGVVLYLRLSVRRSQTAQAG